MSTSYMDANELRSAIVGSGDFTTMMSWSEERGYARGPERELLSALLFDGLQSYLNYSQARSSEMRARFRESFAWIHRRGDSYVFSFESVCDALGIDPDSLRVGLINVESSEILRGKRRT